MAGPNVTITMSAAEAGLVHAWREARRQGPDAYEKSLGKVKATSRGLKGDLDSVLGGVAAKWLSVGAAVQVVGGEMRRAIDLHLQLNRARNEAASTREEAIAKFLNQTQRSSMSEAQRRSIASQVEQTAAVFGVNGPQSVGMATQLATSGVAENEISPFIAEALKFATAQGQPLDSQLLAALVEQVRANDDKVRADTLRQVTQAMFGLQETSLTPEQLIPFSKTNIGLKAAGMSVKEQLAMDATTLDIYSGDASQAATFNRAFVSKLRAPDKASARALQQLVGNTSNVDFIGESMGDVLDRLAKGLEKVDERKRVPLLTQIFGQEYGVQAAELVNRRGMYQENLGRAASGAGLDASAANLLKTGAARARAAEAMTGLGDALEGSSTAMATGSAMTKTIQEQHGSAWRRWASGVGFGIMQGFTGGAVDETRLAGLASAATNLYGGTGGSYRDPTISFLKELFTGGEAAAIAKTLASVDEKLTDVVANTADKGVVIEGDESVNQRRRGTPAKAPLSGVGGR